MAVRDPLLSVEDLSVFHGAVSALRRIDVTVASGELVALLGANGAGKTTLIETIVGAHRPQTGTIRFEEREITSLSGDAIVRAGIAIVPEGRGVFSTLSVLDNLLLGSDHLRSSDPEQLQRVFETFPILAERTRQRAGTLSGGEQRMLVIGRALMSEPRLILFDEPSVGLAPKVVDTLFTIVSTLHDQGYAILLAEQNAAQALAITDRAYVLERGTVVREGTGDALAHDPRVHAAYLGG